jgi:hypothetical protein
MLRLTIRILRYVGSDDSADLFAVVATGYIYVPISAETGSDNAIACTLRTQAPSFADGLAVCIQIDHAFQAGADTFNYRGNGAIPIKSHFNFTSDIAAAYVAGAIVR